ncbi:MAG: cytochrome c biogenesis protein CcsA [bacterium]
MNRVFGFVSSLKLAVILIVLLLIALAVGTIIESLAGADIAGRYVYYAWWFIGLQGLVAANLAMSIASLFPWGRKRIGYLLLHASILLIFAGAVLTSLFKVEGTLHLWEGESSSCMTGPDHSKHIDLPFSVTLQDFVLETYQGTMRPSGFLSIVKVTDLDTGTVFDKRIWMNNELHHRGYSLFQSSYEQRDGHEATVLQVAKDPGQNIVFAGYITLVLGMIAVLLTRIGRKRAQVVSRGNIRAAGAAIKTVTALLLLMAAAGSTLGASTADTLRRLPVQNDGRVMPFDTLAREAIWNVTGEYSWKGEDPVLTVASWIFDSKSARAMPVVKVGSSELAEQIGLPAGTSYVSFDEIVSNPRATELMESVHSAEGGVAGQAPQGVLKAAEKMEARLMKLQSFLNRRALFPLPRPEDLYAQWTVPESLSLEDVIMLMAGPRLKGWSSAEQIDQEILYNKLNPVRLSWIILLFSLVVSIAAWARRSRLLDGVAFSLLFAGFAMMSYGIMLRWEAGGRIPAANMYESMLFLSWGVGLFAVIAYAVLRNRVVVLNAAAMSVITLLLIDLLPIDRFIHPIAPVLAGTPWLAIHVPIIMVGYAVLALGLVVAHMQIGVTIFAPRRSEVLAGLYDLLYWYIFIGSILLVIGILTGSMWAASSWGRYWGWDPKEVWSLVAFLCYMAILHAKVAGLIGRFMVAAISVAAFQTIIMTYLGVNFVLSTGMHSYGMGDSPVLKWMVIVALVELVFLGLGCAMFIKNRGLIEGASPSTPATGANISQAQSVMSPGSGI